MVDSKVISRHSRSQSKSQSSDSDSGSATSSEEWRLALTVLNKTFNILGLPPCSTVSEGKATIEGLILSGEYTRPQLSEIIDKAIEHVREMSEYKVNLNSE